MRLNLYFLSLAAVPLALADQVGYFDSSTCADPSGFASCYDDADEWYADCINTNCAGQNIDCHNACECARQGAYTRCAAASCWNMVYSCEYQLQVSDWVDSCINPHLDEVPFWPPPDNVAGGCSCNVGKVTKAQALSNQVVAACDSIADPFAEDINEMLNYGMACLCCGYSGLLSSLPAFCPRLDPAELQLDGAEKLLADNTPSFDWYECGQYMSGYDCAQEFGYPSNVKEYYSPSHIPTGGTETLRNTGVLTTPASETVYFTAGSVTVQITAVSTDATVPTQSSSSDSDDSDDSDDSSDSSDSSDSNDSSDDSQSGDSDNQSTADDTKPDLGVQMGVHPFLLAVVLATIGVVCVL